MSNIKAVLKDSSGSFELELYKDGEFYKPVRTGAPPQLGKRYACAQPLEKRDGDNISNVDYRSGIVSIGGYNVNLGCGTEVLTTKAGPGIPYCCGMPMSRKEPKPLPSSD